MRRKIVLLTALIALTSWPVHGAGIIAEWLHNEAAGDLIDSTGGQPPGTPIGFPTYNLPGVPNGTYGSIAIADAFGTAIEYGPSTVDEYFEIGTDNNNPVMNLDSTGAFTVAGWMNPFALETTDPRSYKFVSTGSASGADGGWGLALRLTNIDGTGTSIRFTTYGIADNDSATFDLNFGEWIHVAATYDAGTINYYLNGNFLDSDFSSFLDDSANARLTVGSRLGGNDADQMNGLLDGVVVYDGVLTEAEIRQAAIDSVSVPEPATAMMGLVAGIGLLVRRRR